MKKFSKANRHRALGKFYDEEKRDDLPYFLPTKEFFNPITEESIKSGDWLNEFRDRDKGQSYNKYTRYNPVTKRRNKIYIVNLERKNHFEMKAYSDKVEVVLFDRRSVRNFAQSVSRFKIRKEGTGFGKQYYVPDIFTFLKRIVPLDAYCLIAVTGIDLYPRPSWNFVFGKASLKNRIGVFSYRRYMEEPELVFRRIGRVCTHELGHMFGITHCIYYRCLMNGSNSLEESDGRPQLCCPVCLRKFKKNIKFDVTRRYRSLLQFFTKFKFENQRDWVERRLKYCEEMKKKKMTPIQYERLWKKMD